MGSQHDELLASLTAHCHVYL